MWTAPYVIIFPVHCLLIGYDASRVDATKKRTCSFFVEVEWKPNRSGIAIVIAALCPIHTADADETKLSSRVASAV